MDLSTILGLVIGFGMLLVGFGIEGGNMGSLVAISPVFIVFGGTLGALMVSFTLNDILSIPKLVMDTIKLHPDKSEELIDVLAKYSETARKEGLLSLETILNSDDIKKYDPILLRGMGLVIDGTNAELIRNILENELFIREHHRKGQAAIFEAAGGFSPTMGVIGTVMGLVQVLGNMSSPEKLSESIAVAFIATLYGVSFANLVYLPMAGKLKLKMQKEKLEREIIIEGLLSLQAGENPLTIREKLKSFIVHPSKTQDSGKGKE